MFVVRISQPDLHSSLNNLFVGLFFSRRCSNLTMEGKLFHHLRLSVTVNLGFHPAQAAEMTDADDILLAMENLELQAMISAGRTPEEIQLLRKQKVYREVVSMYTFFEKSLDKDNAITTAKDVGISLGVAYENLGRRNLAINALTRANMRCPNNSSIVLMLARLLFRDGRKSEAAALLLQFKETVKSVLEKAGPENDNTAISVDDAADTYYILGWVFIHEDNHSRAYEIWSEGYEIIPNDPRLRRQRNKVQCWANIRSTVDNLECINLTKSESPDLTTTPVRNLIGDGAHMDGQFSRNTDFDCFEIPEDQAEPALGLFDPTTQQRKLIFRTKRPILTCNECAAVIEVVEEYVRSVRGGSWGSVRSASLPTTDVAVEDIPVLRSWLRCLLSTVLQPMLAECFPLLADGSDMGHCGERLRVHDAFIVRYDADRDMSTGLPEHSDTSAVSLTVALNDYDNDEDDDESGGSAGDGGAGTADGNGAGCDVKVTTLKGKDGAATSKYRYKGGGTWFRALQREEREEREEQDEGKEKQERDLPTARGGAGGGGAAAEDTSNGVVATRAGGTGIGEEEGEGSTIRPWQDLTHLRALFV